MIVVTVKFPDERVAGLDHLHTRFMSQEAARYWIDYMQEKFNSTVDSIQEITEDWSCKKCHWRTAPKAPTWAAQFNG